MRDERTCIVCGKKYSYCPHCKSNQANQQWRYLFHDEKCMEIANLLYAYRGSEIGKDEARKRMSNVTPNIEDALKYDSLTAKDIKAIMGVEEKPIEQSDISEEVHDESKIETSDIKINKKRNVKKAINESE